MPDITGWSLSDVMKLSSLTGLSDPEVYFKGGRLSNFIPEHVEDALFKKV
ncbi:hypothetical protein [Metabacillus litoralis]|nr:hypothetical protein [Metabacillus litoralis]